MRNLNISSRAGLLFLALFNFISISSSAQYYNGKSKVIKQGSVTIDSIALVSWPNQIPEQAIYDFDVARISHPTNRIGAKFVIPLSRSFNTANRSHVAVYYSHSNNWSQAQLYRNGLGLTQLKIPLGRRGYYYAVIIGPLGSFIQLFQYDGSRVVQSDRVGQYMQIAGRDIN